MICVWPRSQASHPALAVLDFSLAHEEILAMRLVSVSGHKYVLVGFASRFPYAS